MKKIGLWVLACALCAGGIFHLFKKGAKPAAPPQQEAALPAPSAQAELQFPSRAVRSRARRRAAARRAAEEAAKRRSEAERAAQEAALREAEAKRAAEESAKKEADAKKAAEEQARKEAEAEAKAEELIAQAGEWQGPCARCCSDIGGSWRKGPDCCNGAPSSYDFWQDVPSCRTALRAGCDGGGSGDSSFGWFRCSKGEAEEK